MNPLLLCGAVVCSVTANTAVLPPAEYDKPYPGPILTTIAKDPDEVRLLCKNPNDKLGLGCNRRYFDHCWIRKPKSRLQATPSSLFCAMSVATAMDGAKTIPARARRSLRTAKPGGQTANI